MEIKKPPEAGRGGCAVTLAQLRYFQAVCRYRSMTRAAEALYVSQPSVSSAVRELEREFGVSLFQRRSRGMDLTAEGERFLTLAEELLSHADRVSREMEGLGRRYRPLRLGVPPMIGATFLPQILDGLARSRPDMRMHMAEGGRRELLEQLAAGTLDLAFLPHQGPFPGALRSIPVARLETVCCVPRRHWLATRESVTIQELAREPLVLFKENYFQTESLLARFAQAGLEPNVLLYTDQLSTVRRLVSGSVAVGFLFSALADTLGDGACVPLEPPMPVEVSLVWESGAALTGDMGRFVEYVRNLGPGALPLER